MKDLDSLQLTDAMGRIVVVPDARNFESVDAFDVTTPNDQVLLFQITVGSSHPIKYDGEKNVMDRIRKELK